MNKKKQKSISNTPNNNNLEVFKEKFEEIKRSKTGYTNNKKLKKLDELKFDTVGDEYIFLYEIILSSQFSHEVTDEEKQPTIEYLREIYQDILKNDTLDKKYEGSKRYWFKEQEKAVVDFITCNDEYEKNKIFNQFLYKPLCKLIENIIFTYKLYRTDAEVKDIQQECLSFLITKIEKFNPKTGAQAFSYLGTIAKHKLMGDKRESYKKTKTNIDIDEHMEEASAKPENIYEMEDDSELDSLLQFFGDIINQLQEEIENKNSKMLSNDRRVAEAIIHIFQNHEMLQAYNKNKIYLYFKERTMLHTKDVTYSLQRLKKFYKTYKINFLSKKDEE